MTQAPQPPQEPTQPQQQSSPNNNGGLSERQIGELQMAAQAAAAAQHGPATDNGKHPNEASFLAGDYEAKRQKTASPSQGQHYSPGYSNADA